MPAHAAAPHAISVSVQPRGTTCTETVAKGPNGITAVPADLAIPITLCAHVEDITTRTDQANVPVEFRVTLGTVGASGTSTYSGIVFSSAAGISQVSYRGNGRSTGTDTILATYEGGAALAMTTIEVTPPTRGRVASRIVAMEPPVRALAASNTQPGMRYASPAPGVPIAVQVQDSAERGVDEQILIVRAEGGIVAANPGLAQDAAVLCATAREQVLVVTSNGTNLLYAGGPPAPGAVNFTLCANGEAPPDGILLTIESANGALPPATIALRQAGAPAALSVEATGSEVRARVTDAAGNPVADGTPVRFLVPPALGVVSSTCVASRNGAASVVASLVEDATLLVVADYNATGAAATCGAVGTEQIAATLRLWAATPAATGADGGADDPYR